MTLSLLLAQVGLKFAFDLHPSGLAVGVEVLPLESLRLRLCQALLRLSQLPLLVGKRQGCGQAVVVVVLVLGRVVGGVVRTLGFRELRPLGSQRLHLHRRHLGEDALWARSASACTLSASQSSGHSAATVSTSTAIGVKTPSGRARLRSVAFSAFVSRLSIRI